MFLLALFAALLTVTVRAADADIDYLTPKIITGTIYADASLKQPLFTFRRVATNSGSTIDALREFKSPDGTLAAREHVVYESGKLKSLTLEEFQTGGRGGVKVETVGGEARMNFNFTNGPTKKTGSEEFLTEVLTSDMVGPFIAAHWDRLMKGDTVKCRLVSISRAESVGFKFFKDSDATVQGKPVALVTMQASSIVIARFVDPLHFVIEKQSPHRVLQYTGRTTPSIKRNGKWDDLDGVTVFDWK